MNEYINAMKQEYDHYRSQESIEATKLMVKIQNQLDKVRENYQK